MLTFLLAWALAAGNLTLTWTEPTERACVYVEYAHAGPAAPSLLTCVKGAQAASVPWAALSGATAIVRVERGGAVVAETRQTIYTQALPLVTSP